MILLGWVQKCLVLIDCDAFTSWDLTWCSCRIWPSRSGWATKIPFTCVSMITLEERLPMYRRTMYIYHTELLSCVCYVECMLRCIPCGIHANSYMYMVLFICMCVCVCVCVCMIAYVILIGIISATCYNLFIFRVASHRLLACAAFSLSVKQQADP